MEIKECYVSKDGQCFESDISCLRWEQALKLINSSAYVIRFEGNNKFKIYGGRIECCENFNAPILHVKYDNNIIDFVNLDDIIIDYDIAKLQLIKRYNDRILELEDDIKTLKENLEKL